MGVTAHHRNAWHSEPKLRADNVHNALLIITERMKTNVEFCRVLAECLNLRAARRISYFTIDIYRWGVVVFGCNGEIKSANWALSKTEAIKCLRTCHLMNEV
jgi:hypothetical protein